MPEQALEDRVTRLEEGQQLVGSQFTVAALAIQKLWDELRKTNQSVDALRAEMHDEMRSIRSEMSEFRTDMLQKFATTDANVHMLQYTLDQLVENLPGIIARAIRLA
jgi:hypothetical protein